MFFKHRCEASAAHSGKEVIASAVSNTSAIVAVARASGIAFYNDEGEELSYAVRRHDAKPTCLRWHPLLNECAIGWSDGVVNVVNGETGEPHVGNKSHRDPVSIFEWSPDGVALVSGDTGGTIGVWHRIEDGKIISRDFHAKAGSVSRISFMPVTLVAPTEQEAASGAGLTTVGDGAAQGAVFRSFFVGTDSGVICYGDDTGNCSEMLEPAGSPIDVMQYLPGPRRLVVITRSLVMLQLAIAADGSHTIAMKAKVSFRANGTVDDTCQLSKDALATVSVQESAVRVWDAATKDNYSVPVATARTGVSRTDKVTAVALHPLKRLLAVGTTEGKVVFLRHTGAATKRESGGRAGAAGGRRGRRAHPADAWAPLRTMQVDGSVRRLDWSPATSILSVQLARDVEVLAETELQRHLEHQSAALQVSTNEVVLQQQAGGRIRVTTGLNIRQMHATEDLLVVASAQNMETWRISSPARSDAMAAEGGAIVEPISEFQVASNGPIAAYRDSVFACVGDALMCMSLRGTIKQSISFGDSDGQPRLLARKGVHMAVMTTEGKLFMYDVGRLEPKLVTKGAFEHSESGQMLGFPTYMAVSCDGQHVAVLASEQGADGAIASPAAVGADHRIFVFSVYSGDVVSFELGTNRLPAYAVWDDGDSRLLAVQAQRLLGSGGAATASSESSGAASGAGADGPSGGGSTPGAAALQVQGKDSLEPPVEVLTVFVQKGGKCLLQDAQPLVPPVSALLGCSAPFLYLVSDGAGGEAGGGGAAEGKTEDGAAGSGGGTEVLVVSRPLRDFVGMEDVDEDTKRALLDFSYHLAAGSLDTAYRAVQSVKNPAVWRNMALTCVRSMRLDVAELCLANMGHVRGLRALKKARKEPQEQAQAAMLAVQLGLLPEAAQLYQKAGRFDLLRSLFESCGEWQRALAVADEFDQIHRRRAFHKYGHHLAAAGEMLDACRAFEEAGTAVQEVPRVLSAKSMFPQLKEYVDGRKGEQPELAKWMGQYAESSGDAGAALEYYQSAGDAASAVRVMCGQGQEKMAIDAVASSGDKGAAMILAQQYEAHGDTANAIKYFEISGRYGQAVRLAVHSGMDREALTMALKADSAAMMEAAGYFEGKGELGKAVQLLHRAGELPRALDLCFSARLFDELRSIADDLGRDAPKDTLRRAADFFMSNNQYGKAVGMLVNSGQVDEAIDLCMQHKVQISDKQADEMTLSPDVPEGEDPEAYAARRKELLLKLARALRKQGSLKLATQKYAQAGDRVKAMKCLLKSGDTERIVLFANISRSPEIYVLAANYLQSLDWRTTPDLMRQIIMFYRKARANEQLSSFFEACADVEIDDYRNYEKAHKAMGEAVKYAKKIKTGERESRMAQLEGRQSTITRFVEARALKDTDPKRMEEMCLQLTQQRDAESAVRLGDVFSLLIEHYFRSQQPKECLKMVDGMRQRGINVRLYLEQSDIDAIHQAAGIPVGSSGGAGGGGVDEEEELVDDEDDIPDEE